MAPGRAIGGGPGLAAPFERLRRSRSSLVQMIHEMFFLNVLLQAPRIPARMTPPSPDGNNQE
jgi:hypothetical protein